MNTHQRSPLSSLATIGGLIVLAVAGVTSRNAIGDPITSGLSVWLRADMGITTDGSGNVTAWADQATTDGSQNATQVTTAKMPKFFASGLNGQPVVRFDGAATNGDELVLGNVGSSFTAATLFVVETVTLSQSYSLYATSGNDAYWNFGVTKGYVGPFYSGASFEYRYNQGGSFGNYPGAPLSGSHITEFRAGTDYTEFTDGASLGTLTAANTASDANGGYLFKGGASHVLGGQPNAHFGGDVAEVIIYNRVLTDAERNLVGVYLQERYGISGAYVYVPEPSTLLLLGLGGLMLRRRSRTDA